MFRRTLTWEKSRQELGAKQKKNDRIINIRKNGTNEKFNEALSANQIQLFTNQYQEKCSDGIVLRLLKNN